MSCEGCNRNPGEDGVEKEGKMDTYYNLEDLEKFASIGEESPRLAE